MRFPLPLSNLNIFDAAFALKQIEIFKQDLARLRRYTLDEWKERPILEKIWEHAVSLFESQL
jgi:cardiolipin synthase